MFRKDDGGWTWRRRRYELIPDGLPPSELGDNGYGFALLRAVRVLCEQLLRELITRLNSGDAGAPIDADARRVRGGVRADELCGGRCRLHAVGAPARAASPDASSGAEATYHLNNNTYTSHATCTMLNSSVKTQNTHTKKRSHKARIVAAAS
ncbi:hypothetical protein ABZP36_020695 [Zizania latifolia]